jgi:hypothetical protein
MDVELQQALIKQYWLFENSNSVVSNTALNYSSYFGKKFKIGDICMIVNCGTGVLYIRHDEIEDFSREYKLVKVTKIEIPYLSKTPIEIITVRKK